jgi:hypothetical protein
MACASSGLQGFVSIANTSGNSLNSTALQSILVNDAPLSIAFAGTTSITRSGFNMSITEASVSTCRYKGSVYSLVDIQFCSPIHTGYTDQGSIVNQKAELILTYVNTSQQSWAAITHTSYILLCVFIHVVEYAHHDTFIKYLKNPTASTPVSLETLFYNDKTDKSQTSFSYTSCIMAYDTPKDSTPPATVDRGSSNAAHLQSSSMHVIVFPHGVGLTIYAYNDYMQSLVPPASPLLPLLPYHLPGQLRNTTNPTVSSSESTNDGRSLIYTLSSDGLLPTYPAIQVGSSIFSNNLQYYLQPPLTSGSSAASGCKTRPTSQYKCVPITEANNIANNKIVIDPSGSTKDLQTILKELYSEKQNSDSNSSSSINPSNISDTAIQFGAASVLGLIIGGIYILLKEDKE